MLNKPNCGFFHRHLGNWPISLPPCGKKHEHRSFVRTAGYVLGCSAMTCAYQAATQAVYIYPDCCLAMATIGHTIAITMKMGTKPRTTSMEISSSPSSLSSVEALHVCTPSPPPLALIMMGACATFPCSISKELCSIPSSPPCMRLCRGHNACRVVPQASRRWPRL